jgi:hypothetical protein
VPRSPGNDIHQSTRPNPTVGGATTDRREQSIQDIMQIISTPTTASPFMQKISSYANNFLTDKHKHTRINAMLEKIVKYKSNDKARKFSSRVLR